MAGEREEEKGAGQYLLSKFVLKETKHRIDAWSLSSGRLHYWPTGYVTTE
jgi:hypothetical protein